MKIMTAAAFRSEQKTDSPSVTNDPEIDQAVLGIIADVRKRGDVALLEYAKKFDGALLDDLVVLKDEIDEAKTLVSEEFLLALEQARENIRSFHAKQKEETWLSEMGVGIKLGQKITPIEKVGVYVPGGKAAYPSTVLMDVIPAKIAGVKSVSVATPPMSDGKINPHVLVACDTAGADRIYKMGGAQAIAALAYGTETIEKVFKIVGPGNAYVARAKKWVFGDVAIDMIAGPSEICVVADETANAKFVAADLLSQAEHDERASSVCIAINRTLAEKIKKEVERQAQQADRKEIIQKSLEQNGRIIVAETLSEAFELVNLIAPEHLQLMIENPAENMRYVQNAGAIFLGNYSPEPLGDYFAGPNHTLPTNGTAAFSSPLGVYDFMKKSSVIHYSKDALLDAADKIITIAKTEGLMAHANSIKIRKED